jgi:hypothetical protein
MNFNNVVSLPAAVNLAGLENTAVKLTATGVDVAGATDRVIGTVIRGAAAGGTVDVFLKANGFHYVRIGSTQTTALAVGDELEQAAGGTYIKKSAGQVTALAIEAAPGGSNNGGQIRAILL